MSFEEAMDMIGMDNSLSERRERKNEKLPILAEKKKGGECWNWLCDCDGGRIVRGMIEGN